MSPTLGRQATQRYLEIIEALPDGTTGIGRLREYVAMDRIAEFAELEQARHEVFTGAGLTVPPTVTTIVNQLWGEPSAVQIDVNPTDQPPGAIYLPTVLPVHEGEVVAPGDFRGQYTWCLERAGELLGALGLDLSHLVQTIDFSTSDTREVYSRCGRPRRELLGPVYPGAAGILLERLPHPDILVAFEFVASTFRPEAVNPGWARYETLTYNPAVRAGTGIYGSGFAALDPVSQLAVHEGDADAQARFTYASIDAVLEAAGGQPQDLVQVDEYICPGAVASRSAIAAAREAVLGHTTPVVTSVGCGTLLRPQFLLEVIPTAIVGA